MLILNYRNREPKPDTPLAFYRFMRAKCGCNPWDAWLMTIGKFARPFDRRDAMYDRAKKWHDAQQGHEDRPATLYE